MTMDRDDQMTVDMTVMDFMRDHPSAPMAEIIRAAVTAAEPMIRADEREHGAHTRQEGWLNTESHRKVVLADIRNKVESLLSHHPTELVDYQWNLAINAVLDLLDGSDDA